jgi:uncharacterized protein (DUF302 family)
MSYGMSTTLPVPYGEALTRVRDALSEQGFGVLTEIDVKATLKAKLDADMEDYVILGACNPTLAHQALETDRSIGLLLPCNVVVRAVTSTETRVEILDPTVIAGLSPTPTVERMADAATTKLHAALEALNAAD